MDCPFAPEVLFAHARQPRDDGHAFQQPGTVGKRGQRYDDSRLGGHDVQPAQEMLLVRDQFRGQRAVAERGLGLPREPVAS